MRTQLFSILALVAILATPSLVSAAPADRGQAPEVRMARLFELLDVDDGQQDQLEQIFSRHHATADERREAVGTARRTLDEQVRAETFDEVAIRDAAAALARIEADLAVERATMLQQVRGILSPDQFELFAEFHGHRMGMMHERPGRAGGMHKRPHRHGH